LANFEGESRFVRLIKRKIVKHTRALHIRIIPCSSGRTLRGERRSESI